jgi:hypothetical protein
MNLRKAALIAVLTFSASQAFAAPGECFLEVDGRVFINGVCSITVRPGGSFQIRDSLRPTRYFAFVDIDPADGTARATWNEEPRASRAHSDLGSVVRQGGCWVNARARVCAWKPGTRPRDFQ